MTNFKDIINEFVPYNDLTKVNKELFIKYYNIFGDKLFDRSLELLHVTSSAIILNEKLDKMLCIKHNIYKNYGWVGGHNDLNPNCLEVAIKEAKEETGIVHFKPFSDEIFSLDILPVPTHIKNGKRIPYHLHLNVTFVFLASEDDTLHIKEDENSDVRWIDIDKLNQYTNEKEVLNIYLSTIENVRKMR